MKWFLSQNSIEKVAPTSVTHRSGFCRYSPAVGRPNRDAEKGAGRLKAIVWTLVLASFVYVAVKVVPTLVNEYQFQDGMQTIARFATVNRQTPEQIRDSVLKEAQKDDVPIVADDIKVEAVRGNIKINVNYSVMVDLIVYQWTLNFHPAVSNDSLT